MNTLRPDEIATQSQIRRNLEQSKSAKKGIKTAAGIASTALGVGLSSKVLPFLNEYLPLDLAIKGISKVSPEIGNILKKGQSMGLDLKEGMEFIREKLKPEQPKEHPIIAEARQFETEYPDIAQAIENYINQGQTPEAAAAIVKQSTPFSAKIKKIEKEKGKNFIDYILELFSGGQGQGQQTQQQSEPQQQSQSFDPKLLQIMQGIQNSIQKLRGNNG